MKEVFCLDDGMKYYFATDDSHQAMNSMLYTLNLMNLDKNAKIELLNGRTLSLVHNGKTYSCLI